MMNGFEYFLSCDIPGRMEGECYIRTQEMVLEILKRQKQQPIARFVKMIDYMDESFLTDHISIVIQDIS
jgi:hypothetical protein